MTAATLPRLSPTPPAWAAAAAAHVDTLLLDQAHLEKKAAAGANALLFKLPPEFAAHRALSRLAREELLHFERTLQLLQQRGIAFTTLPPAAYAERLKRVPSPRPQLQRCDELLLAAIIEARSHERMQALAAALQAEVPEVAAFYRELVAAEARHADVYVDLAQQRFGAATVAARWQVLAAHEAAVLASLPFEPRLHAGAPEPGDGG